ncbi:replication protein P [Alcaligenes phenolicus]|uniref:Replication protein P n=1 Tax=Alcaligenes phenolicus TaxID=232846 RepID=A0ABV2BDM8_9BURK
MSSISDFSNPWLLRHTKLEGISLMDHLYNRLNGIYPNKFRSNFRDKQAIEDWKQAWAEAFDEEGVSPNDVALGIKNCRRMFDWPPSLPEFLRACRPQLEPETAFFQAVRGMQARVRGEMGEWSHPAIYHAAISIGQFDMLNQAYTQLEQRWHKVLGDQLAKGQWAEIPPPRLALTSPQDWEQGRREGQRRVRDLAQVISGDTDKDPRVWANRILARPEACSLAVLKMAKAALGKE